MPGFATFHIGIEADNLVEAKDDEVPTILSHDVAFEPDMSVENLGSSLGPDLGMDDNEPTEE